MYGRQQLRDNGEDRSGGRRCVFALTTGDMDQDGRPELAVLASDWDARSFYHLFESPGDNAYDLVWLTQDIGYPEVAQVAADLDADGVKEFVTGTFTNGIRVWESTGNDRYVPVWGMPLTEDWCPGWAYDLNQNGYEELIVSENGDPRARYGLRMGIYELESIQPPVIIYTWPDSLEPVLHPGQRFKVYATFFNHTDKAETLEAWSMLGHVVGEESEPTIGPLVGPVPLTIPAQDSVCGQVVHQVPPNPPAGVYAYYVYVGHYPDRVVDWKLFWLTVERGVENGPTHWPGEWRCTYAGGGSRLAVDGRRRAVSGQRQAGFDPTLGGRIFSPGAVPKIAAPGGFAEVQEERWRSPLQSQQSPIQGQPSAVSAQLSAAGSAGLEPNSAFGIPQARTDAGEDVVVSVSPRGQYFPHIVPDGKGGAILVWRDNRTDPYFPDIYAQRVDGSVGGNWPQGDVGVCTNTAAQWSPVAIADGFGGCIVAWTDDRHYFDIYAQRLDSVGGTLWIEQGVPVCTEAHSQDYACIVSDGMGGAILAWQDERRTLAYDIYAQRVNANGSVLWPANGIPICDIAGSQYYPAISSDQRNGALVAWQDQRSGNRDIYAQRVGGAGSVYWTVGGIPVSTRPENEELPLVVSDGASGGIIVWRAWNGLDWDLNAQRVDSSGNLCWGPQGVLISGEVEHQWHHAIVEDGHGGVIVAWQDLRSDVRTPDVYVQRIDSVGNARWGEGGIPVCTAPGTQGPPSITSDGNGGAFIAWHDGRGGDYDLYAQHVDAGGNFLWEYNGRLVSGAPEGQWWPVLCPDGSGGAWVGWHDYRNPGMVADIYAHHISDIDR